MLVFLPQSLHLTTVRYTSFITEVTEVVWNFTIERSLKSIVVGVGYSFESFGDFLEVCFRWGGLLNLISSC